MAEFAFGPSPGALRWAEEQLARYTYKPGWVFNIWPGAYDVELRVRFTAPNTHNPDEEIVIEGKFPIPSMMDWERHRHIGSAEELFAKDLERIIWRVERHESQEWLRRDGTIYNNPHK